MPAQFYFIPDQEIGTAYVRDEPGVCNVGVNIVDISGTNLVTNKTLYRKITINLMDKQTFEHGSDVTRISNESLITDAVNQEVDIDIPFLKALALHCSLSR